jgi:hypothetical protein
MKLQQKKSNTDKGVGFQIIYVKINYLTIIIVYDFEYFPVDKV